MNRWVAKLRADDVAFPQQERNTGNWKLFLRGEQTRIKGNAKSGKHLKGGPSLGPGAEPSTGVGKGPLPWSSHGAE